ncbi:MAG: hypothetical protein GY910_15230 [bacterium]|nr:hypothetical protein [Deltaproteobacteria bacterium]MCP4906328.1 hypothetical protein [bacterium]
MRRAFLVIVTFAAITMLLTWLWTHGGRGYYGYFLKLVAPPIYDAIGFGDARVGAYRQRYINFIPFVGLVLVTPGIVFGRRLIGLFGGLFALFVGHLSLNLTEGVHPKAQLPVVASMISDALPFVIWILVAYPVISGWFADVLVPPAPEESDTVDPPR